MRSTTPTDLYDTALYKPIQRYFFHTLRARTVYYFGRLPSDDHKKWLSIDGMEHLLEKEIMT